MTEISEPRATPGAWERWWPRFLAVLQASIGTIVIVYELLSGTERPYLLGIALVLLIGAPATGFAARLLATTSSK